MGCMTSLKSILLLVGFLLSFTSFLHAENYVLIEHESYLKLRARYLVFFSVNAEFSTFKGEIIWNENQLNASSFKGEAAIENLSTGSALFDKQLHSDAFFDKKQFPLVLIESVAISHIDQNKFQVEALLTVKDVTKRIKEILVVTSDDTNSDKLIFSSTFKLSRKEFGLTQQFDQFVVHDRVDVAFKFSTIKKSTY